MYLFTGSWAFYGNLKQEEILDPLILMCSLKVQIYQEKGKLLGKLLKQEAY